MPRRVHDPLLQDIHNCQKYFLEQLVGKPLTPLQWTQAKLPTKAGGLDLLSPRLELGLDIVHLTDLSFLASLKNINQEFRPCFLPFHTPNSNTWKLRRSNTLLLIFPNSPLSFRIPRKNLITPKPSNISTPKPKPNYWNNPTNTTRCVLRPTVPQGQMYGWRPFLAWIKICWC